MTQSTTRKTLCVLLAIGWVLFFVILAGLTALISNGDGAFGLVPFLIAAILALVDRLRNALTVLGAAGVALSIGPAGVAVAQATADAHRGGGYRYEIALAVFAVIVVVADIGDRVSIMRHTRR